MTTINFNMQKFLLDNRISAMELASKINKDYGSIWRMAKTNKIKIQTLRDIEAKYGNCNQYINEQETTTPKVA